MFTLMIPEVAKLYSHDDDDFNEKMSEIEANMLEGITDFEVEVQQLDPTQQRDIAAALSALGYIVDFNDTDQMISVSF